MPAKKAFSQNFLIDPAIPLAIAAALPAHAQDSAYPVLEIGAGHGALTLPLLAHLGDSRPLIAVEVEPACLKTMHKLAEQHPNLTILGQNILGVWPETLGLTSPVHCVGNLPYHMTGQILFHFCGEMADPAPRWRPWVASFTLMVQREVAERIAAQPGNASLNPLSWSIQTWFEVKRVLDVPSRAFKPVPKVQSAVIQLIPRPQPLIHVEAIPLAHKLIQAGFRQPRKTLKNNMLAAFGADHPLWAIIPEATLTQRPHMLPLTAWKDWALAWLSQTAEA
jgi:16S rRNA (adenine1518-N6/adenine1519-N6)-dimethyltransferase